MITSRNVFSSYESFMAAILAADRIDFCHTTTSKDDTRSCTQKANELKAESLKLLTEVKLDRAMPLANKLHTAYEAFQLHLSSLDLQSGVNQHEYLICLEQRFAAFSDLSVLKAINVISCVFLVLVHRGSQFTFGAHIDAGTSTQHITDAITMFLSKIDDHDAEFTCHLVGGDATTQDNGTLEKIYFALKDLNIALGKQALTLYESKENLRHSYRPLNIAYDPVTATFYESKVSFSNKLRKIQSTIFYILCHEDVPQELPLHVIASHRQDTFEYYPLQISKESMTAWMASAKEKEFENNFVKTILQHLGDLFNEPMESEYSAVFDEILYEIAEAYRYVDCRLNNKSLFFQPRAASDQPVEHNHHLNNAINCQTWSPNQ